MGYHQKEAIIREMPINYQGKKRGESPGRFQWYCVKLNVSILWAHRMVEGFKH